MVYDSESGVPVDLNPMLLFDLRDQWDLARGDKAYAHARSPKTLRPSCPVLAIHAIRTAMVLPMTGNPNLNDEERLGDIAAAQAPDCPFKLMSPPGLSNANRDPRMFSNRCLATGTKPSWKTMVVYRLRQEISERHEGQNCFLPIRFPDGYFVFYCAGDKVLEQVWLAGGFCFKPSCL